MWNNRKSIRGKGCERKVNEYELPRLNAGAFGEGWVILNEAGEGREWSRGM